jgi:hypothetical protein
VAIIFCIEVGFQIARDGQPHEPHSATAGILTTALIVGLLYAGGFWS